MDKRKGQTVSKDISILSEKYDSDLSLSKGGALSVLSRNYEKQNKNFQMFIGGTPAKKQLENFVAGEYVKIIISPKLRFL